VPWFRPNDPTPREQCPCCGYITLAERLKCLICPVCFWEDDAFVGDSLDEPSDCNKITLREARVNFADFGACDRKGLAHVVEPWQRSLFDRKPFPEKSSEE
jgi:hypothetical protein